MKKTEGGFVGLIMLLVTVVIIALLSVKLYFSPQQSEVKTTNEVQMQNRLKGIEEAQHAKDLIENRLQAEVNI